MKKWIDLIGWCGAVLLLAAYAAISFGYLSRTDPTYQFLNLIGAAGIAFQAYHRRAYPASALNVIWMILAAIALLWR